MATAWELVQIYARRQALDTEDIIETLSEFLSSRGSSDELNSDICERIDEEGLAEFLTEKVAE